MPDETPELTIETVTAIPVAELTDDHKAFLQEHAEDLSDEQKETLKDVIKPAKEPDLNPDDITPEERNPKKDTKPDDTKPDPDDDVDPDDEKTIGKVVDKKLKAVSEQLKEVQHLRDEAEVTAFIQVKPEFGKYRGAMLKYLAHPSYKNIPVHSIAVIVAAKDLEKIGAEKEREAQRKAADTKDKGSTARQPLGKVDWNNATRETVAEQRSKIFGHQ
jgi:hypothetical protein